MTDIQRIEELFYADQGAVFIQEEPNTAPLFVGCVDVGDVTQSLGDVSRKNAIDKAGRFNVVSRVQSQPSETTVSLTGYLGKNPSWIEKLKCVSALYINHVPCGNKGVFASWDRAELLTYPFITSKNNSNNLLRDSAENAQASFSASTREWIDKQHLTSSQLTTAEPIVIYSIAKLSEDRCSGACGDSSSACDVLGATTLCAGAPAFGHVILSYDGGNTWAVTAANPFAAGQGIAGIAGFYIGTTKRILVGRGLPGTLGSPARIAYSDDWGASWTLVDLVTTNNAYIRALFAFDRLHIWVTCSDGTVHFSDDGGVTFTVQTTATSEIYAISFVNENIGMFVGVGNICYYTVDGGLTWTAVTGPAPGDSLYSCKMIDRLNWWVGQDDNELWYTTDGGATWTQRDLPLPTGIIVNVGIFAMTWYNHFVGWVMPTYIDGGGLAGDLYETIDGGYSWERIEFGAYIFGAINCDPNKVFGSGGTVPGHIFKAEG